MSFLKRRAPLRHVKAVRLHTFVLEQPHLARDAARVTGEAPVGSYYAMAGDDDADGVMAHRSPHGQGRRAASAALLRYLLGEGSVRCHFAVGDLREQSPYQALELAADGRERNLLKDRASASSPAMPAPWYFCPSSHRPQIAWPSLASVSFPTGESYSVE